jgi:hypothetical protein
MGSARSSHGCSRGEQPPAHPDLRAQPRPDRDAQGDAGRQPAPDRRRQQPAAVQLAAVRVGAAAVGAAAVGVGAVGALAVGRLAVGRAVVRRLQIEDLEVTRLHVHELRVDQQATAAQPAPRRPPRRSPSRPQSAAARSGCRCRGRGWTPASGWAATAGRSSALAWLLANRRLTIRYERRADILTAFLRLACAMVSAPRCHRCEPVLRRADPGLPMWVARGHGTGSTYPATV